jgi:hypothetical protein
MFSTPEICCSTGAEIFAATTSAFAPVKTEAICTVGGVISGNWAIGRVRIAARPPIVMIIEITEAKIGRSMQKRESMVAVLGRLGIPGSCFR